MAKPSSRADRTQGGGLGGEKSLQHPSGGAQGFHEGKVAAAVGDPSRQSGKHAYRGGENDQNRGHQKRGAHFAQHIGLALRDLAHGADVSFGKSLRQALDVALTSCGEPEAEISTVEYGTWVHSAKSAREM